MRMAMLNFAASGTRVPNLNGCLSQYYRLAKADGIGGHAAKAFQQYARLP
jgi:hypothetical protein